MVKRIQRTLLLLTAFSALVPTVLAQSADAKTEQSVKAFEEQWLHALLIHDRVQLDRILADSFVDTTWQGELHSKQQVLDGLATRSPYSQTLTEMTVHVYADTAVVRGVNVISDNGREVTRIRFTDILLRTQDGWQAIAAQETPEVRH